MFDTSVKLSVDNIDEVVVRTLDVTSETPDF